MRRERSNSSPWPDVVRQPFVKIKILSPGGQRSDIETKNKGADFEKGFEYLESILVANLCQHRT